MFGIILLTLYKAREPAFMIVAAIGLLMAYCVSGADQFSSQIGDSSIIGAIVAAENGGAPLMTSSFFALALSIILAIFVGAGEIPREIESGMILIILAKPVRKEDYMLGKYFGILILSASLFLAMTATVCLSHLYYTGHLYSFSSICRQLYLLLALLPLVAITVALSCVLADIAAMIVSGLYILFSLVFSFIPIMVAILPKGIAENVESYLFIIYYFFPNYIFYFQPFRIVGVVSFSLIVYSISLAAIFLTIGAAFLRSRDLSPNG